MEDDPVSPDIWLNCPDCHSFMVPLKTYEVQDEISDQDDNEIWQTAHFGSLGRAVYSFLFGAAKIAGERTQLEKDKTEILPVFPNSQICPKCFTVAKRR